MSASTALIVGVALTTAAMKAAGPIAAGGRRLPTAALSVVAMLAPALLAALVVTSAFADGTDLAVGADTAGVAAGGAAALWGRSVIVCVLVAAVVCAVLRAV